MTLLQNSTPDHVTDAYEDAQQQLYDAIADRYDAHFSDDYSCRYRERFMTRPLFAGVPLQGATVLEAMCGGGQLTGALIAAGARVTGLDISAGMLRRFRERWPAADAVRGSIFASGLPSGSFDVVAVLSGLHHLHPRVPEAVDEIHRILKPGGFFVFSEPHAGSLPDLIRRAWYRFDRTLFEANEAAIDLGSLERLNAGRFDMGGTTYGGNVASVFVLHSLVVRLPLAWKRWYAPPLLWLEGLVAPWQGRRASCFMVSRWRKRSETTT